MDQHVSDQDQYISDNPENNIVSETFGKNITMLPKASERKPDLSEKNLISSQNVPKASERTDHHFITVREAAKIFEDADVPRTERSIINWCNQNKYGEWRLDCYYDQSQRKYYITPDSIQKVVNQEKVKARSEDQDFINRLSETREEFSESFGKKTVVFPKASERKDIPSEALPKEISSTVPDVLQIRSELEEKNKHIATMELEIRTLQEKNIRAESSTGYKDELLTYFKNQISHDREDYSKRMTFMQEQVVKLQDQGNKYVEQVIESQRRIGLLESQVRQLEAPKQERQYEKKEMILNQDNSNYQPNQVRPIYAEEKTEELNKPHIYFEQENEKSFSEQNRSNENTERFSQYTDTQERDAPPSDHNPQ